MYATQTPQMAGFPPLPQVFSQAIDFGGGYIVPGLGRVFCVRGDGTTVSNLDDQYSQMTTNMERRLWPSVYSVLADSGCKANRGDTIMVFPGHTENISAADYLTFVAGMRIMCLGWGTLVPTFTYTLSTSTLILDSANVAITGGRFLCAGPAGTTSLTVAAPFTISADGCVLQGNQFEVGIDSNQICGTFCAISGDRVTFSDNVVENQDAAAAITDLITLTAANKFVMERNRIKAAVTTAATGVVRSVTTASTDIYIHDNVLHNQLANSTGVLNFSAALACTGTLKKNLLIMEKVDDITTAIQANAANDLRLDDNKVINEKNKTTVAIGTACDA